MSRWDCALDLQGMCDWSRERRRERVAGGKVRVVWGPRTDQVRPPWSECNRSH